MRTASNAYTRLRIASGSHYEVQVVRGTTLYGMDKLYSVDVTHALFDEDGPSIGGISSAQGTIVLEESTSNWPRMAEFTIRIRLRSEDDSEYSEWISIGTFYTDERSEDGYGRLTIIGYDKMLMTEQPWMNGIQTQPESWPITAQAAANIVSQSCDIQIDPRTSLDNSVKFIGMNTTATGREILRDIGAAMGGNWRITPEGKLHLVKFNNADYETKQIIYDMTVSGETASIPGHDGNEIYVITGESETTGVDCAYVGLKAFSLTRGDALAAVSGVSLTDDSGASADAGTDTGYTLKGHCNFSDNTAVANLALSNVSGYVYKPFSATGALIDPLAEIGDIAIVDGEAYQIVRVSWFLGANISADISAPVETEVDHEYTVQTAAQKALIKAIDADEKLEQRVNSYIEQTAESITAGVAEAYETKSDSTTKYNALNSQITITAQGIEQSVSATYSTKTELNDSIDELRSEMEGAIETFSGSDVPTLSNYPASGWTQAQYASHVGDLYIVNSDGGDYAGLYYRFEQSGNDFRWAVIQDNALAQALAAAQAAQEAADGVATNLANNYSTTVQMNAAISTKANEITSTVSETYQTKTAAASDLSTAKTYAEGQATDKASAAETNAKNYTDSNLRNYSTTAEMQSQIAQSATDITSTVSSTYETKSASASKLTEAKEYADDQADDAKSYANGVASDAEDAAKEYTDTKLTSYSTTTQMNSTISQSASSITSSVSRTYETKTDATSKLNSANAHADSVAGNAESAAKSYADTQVSSAKSEIKQTTDAIESTVSTKVGNDEVISKINQSAEQITINANKVNLQGYVTFTNLETDGETTINGGNLMTGTVTAGSLLVGDYGNLVTVTEEVTKSMLPSGHIYGATVTEGRYVRKGNSANEYLGLSSVLPNSFTLGDELYYELYGYASSAGPVQLALIGYDRPQSQVGVFMSQPINFTTKENKFTGSLVLNDAFLVKNADETMYIGGTVSNEILNVLAALGTSYTASSETLNFTGRNLDGWKFYGLVISGSTGRQVYVRDAIVRRKSNGVQIVDGAITAQKIAANTITGDQIQAGSITGNEIAANTITADNIAAGSLTADLIDATDLHVDAANIDGELVIGQLPESVAELSDLPTKTSELTNDSDYQTSSQVTTITNDTIRTTNVVAQNLKVNAANINGTLTIGQLPGTVAEESDIPTKVSELTNDSGYQTESGVTTIAGGVVSTAKLNADNITSGTLNAARIGSNTITASKLATAVNNDISTAKSNASTALTNAATAQATANKANTKEQLIYISKTNGTTSVSAIETWITNSSGDQNTWTIKRPQYSQDYPVLFVATQRQTVAGVVSCTTPVIDQTTTVLDGGSIITGTVTANQLAANSVTADKISVSDLKALDATIGGFNIGTTSIYNGMTSLSDTTYDGVYVGTDGIALGKGSFKVDSNGTLTATKASITGDILSHGDFDPIELTRGYTRITDGTIYLGSQSELLGPIIDTPTLALKTSGEFMSEISNLIPFGGIWIAVGDDNSRVSYTINSRTGNPGHKFTGTAFFENDVTVSGTLSVGGATVLAPVLLWTNDSPSSDMGSKTISIPTLGEYDMVYVGFAQRKELLREKSGVWLHFGSDDTIQHVLDISDNSGTRYCRKVNFNKTQKNVVFSTARQFTWGQSGYAQLGNICIPLIIYGIKI